MVGRVVAILALFLILVVPHEGGHFALAKLFGVQVREFSVGMGPRLWSTVRGGTLYALRALPLGGYVHLAGMAPDDSEDPSGFHSRPAYQRLLVLLGGPAVNFLVAALVMTGVYVAQVNDDAGKIAGAHPGTPAWSHGIRPGDSISSVDGRPIRNSDDIRKAEDASPGQPLLFQVRHEGGGTFATTVTPGISDATGLFLARVGGDPGAVIGVVQDSPAWKQQIRQGDVISRVDGRSLAAPDDVRRAEDGRAQGRALRLDGRHQDGTSFSAAVTPLATLQANRYVIGVETSPLFTPAQAFRAGATFPFVAAGAIGQGVWDVASGKVPGGFLGPSGVSGPIGFGFIAYHAAGEGLVTYLIITSLLSMALGLTNLLPLPALDGGRIVVVGLEKLRGRPFDREREQALQRYGLVALIALMALIAFFDVQRIATGQFPGTR